MKLLAFGLTMASANIIDRLNELHNSMNSSAAIRTRFARDLSATGFGSLVNNYGCYCMFTPDTFKTVSGDFSNAVDQYDEICKIYHESAVCTRYDDLTCEPLTTEYITTINVGNIANSDIEADCNNQNGADTCEANVCILEQSFLKRFEALITVGVLPRVTLYGHALGYNPVDNCPKVAAGVNIDNDKECCGDYLVGRKMYKTFGGAMECCADFSVKTAGSCLN
jgi:hypothetical protein